VTAVVCLTVELGSLCSSTQPGHFRWDSCGAHPDLGAAQGWGRIKTDCYYWGLGGSG